MALPRTIVWGEIGQSFSRSGLQESGGYYGLVSALAAAIDDNHSDIATTLGISVSAGGRAQMRMNSVDGSAILQANAGSAGYWITNGYASGPLLTSTTSAISGYSTKPHFYCHRHGQQDATAITTEAASFDVKVALPIVWAAIRTANGKVNGQDVPIFLDLIGPRFPQDELAEYWIRDRMIELLDSGTITNLYRGAETYALQLGSDTHPISTPPGYIQMGAQSGRKAAQWLVDKTELRGPQIDSDNIAIVSGVVNVPILTPSGGTLIKPAAPDFFGLFDNSDNRIPITGYAWSGDTLKLSYSTTPSKVRYPCPTGATKVDITNIIRLSDPSPAFYTGEPGLFLESVKTIML